MVHPAHHATKEPPIPALPGPPGGRVVSRAHHATKEPPIPALPGPPGGRVVSRAHHATKEPPIPALPGPGRRTYSAPSAATPRRARDGRS
jgi:hypothetical protein